MSVRSSLQINIIARWVVYRSCICINKECHLAEVGFDSLVTPYQHDLPMGYHPTQATFDLSDGVIGSQQRF